VHATSSAGVFNRLIEMGVEPFLLASASVASISQRLVRALCPHCRETGSIDDDAWKSLTAPYQMPKPANAFVAKGCLECRMTGYMGRVGIYEMMTLSPAQRRLISAETDLNKVREQAMRDGMKPLRVSGALKIAAGLTTVEEVMKVAPPATGDRRAV